MGTNYADEEAVKYRFLTQTAVTRGDPPFKKLLKKYVAFCDELQHGSVAKAEDEYKQLSRELASVEYSLEKWKYQGAALERESLTFTQLGQDMDADICKALQVVEDKKRELEESKIDRQHQEEYEALKRLIVRHPSRLNTQQEIERYDADIAATELEHNRAQLSLERKQKQFALLLHTVSELQKTLEEEDKARDTAATEGTATPTPMQLG